MTDSAELLRINAVIHDGWFELDGVVHDTERSELRLTVHPGRLTGRGRLFKAERPPAEQHLPPPIGELIVRNVADVTIVDNQRIGWFNVGTLEFDAHTSKVRLRAPCRAGNVATNVASHG